jgi:hypothetical protein
MYIELKTGYSDDGPAWIGVVEFSKSGRTAYFNGHAFKHAGKGHYGDIETGENYWISGVKKNGEDRHRFGKGKILIDKVIVYEYLKLVDFDYLPSNKYELIEIPKTDKSKFVSIENEKLEETFDFYSLRDKEVHNLTNEELEFLIDYCYNSEKNSIHNKSRRSIKQYRIDLEEELEKRNT